MSHVKKTFYTVDEDVALHEENSAFKHVDAFLV